jgi:hypothetical protein
VLGTSSEPAEACPLIPFHNITQHSRLAAQQPALATTISTFPPPSLSSTVTQRTPTPHLRVQQACDGHSAPATARMSQSLLCSGRMTQQ